MACWLLVIGCLGGVFVSQIGTMNRILYLAIVLGALAAVAWLRDSKGDRELDEPVQSEVVPKLNGGEDEHSGPD